MLELKSVFLQQGDFTLSANISINPGRKAAVLGPSGAGKSTLLAIIAGFLAPNAGRILWEGHDLTRLSPAQRPVSILFQDGNLFPHLSARDNVGLGLNPSLRLSSSQSSKVEAALERMGLGGLG
ncbi:MAG: ATP-binding cassette domain-containing protein, partial [Rhodobacteraceae bacterium]|nr:ATP-binding cassette domain-containing protein [Paracoccaceae bacterium]